VSAFVSPSRIPGREALQKKGFAAAYKWLFLRRTSQLAILATFLAGPWLGVWIIKGNLSASLLFDTVPMSDPLVVLQSLAAGHWPYVAAWLGLAVVLAFYLLAGGRVYCSWVCPMNLVTDGAAALRRRFGLKTGKALPRSLRYWLLGALLAGSAIAGMQVWEPVNPVSQLHRALIFGGGTLASTLVAGVFLYDLAIAPRGWCGHVCPMGATYALINRASLVRVAAPRRASCTDCLDCFAVCPEPQVIRPALKGSGSPLIADASCTNCGRCIDVCSESVFEMTNRFARYPTRRDAP
jgi:ferredoxin-type protein NapH